MGPDGFISCFDYLIPVQALRRKIVLKGGPGVGKSTFMRRVHAALCPQGEESTLYFCSGDPDSLDAVAVPHAGVLVLDGTAPHVVDPQIPGARDSVINLGECLNEAAMRPRLPQIRACMDDHTAAIRRARACMQAACALRKDNAALAAGAQDGKRLAQMTRALTNAALTGDAPPQENPSVRPVIADAITPKGEISLIAQGTPPRVIRLCSHWAQDVTPALRAVSFAARAAGYSVEEYLCPTVPGWLMHLGIPALGVLITTSELPASEQTFDFSACLPQNSLLRHECTLEQGRAGVKLHLHRAASSLARSREIHDELESFYVPNMDFTAWQHKLDALLLSLGAS